MCGHLWGLEGAGKVTQHRKIVHRTIMYHIAVIVSSEWQSGTAMRKQSTGQLEGKARENDPEDDNMAQQR